MHFLNMFDSSTKKFYLSDDDVGVEGADYHHLKSCMH